MCFSEYYGWDDVGINYYNLLYNHQHNLFDLYFCFGFDFVNLFFSQDEQSERMKEEIIEYLKLLKRKGIHRVNLLHLSNIFGLETSEKVMDELEKEELVK